MLELPECFAVSRQLDAVLAGKTVVRVIAGKSPHKFAFFEGDPKEYGSLWNGKTIQAVRPIAGFIEISAQKEVMLLGEGVNIRYVKAGEKIPDNHQLCMSFDDGTALVCSVQMYGGMWAYPKGTNGSPYYKAAIEKPSPLSDFFDKAYWAELIGSVRPTLSLKAFLATEQRIPGLGNGVLQDILYNARLHPKRKLASLTAEEKEALLKSLKETLQKMAAEGGRDIEKDIYGNPGGYLTKLSNKTAGTACSVCGEMIQKETFLGGRIYFCRGCQNL